MGDKKEKEDFGMYIKNMRKKKKYTLDQLCLGLCTPQQLSKVEKGEKSMSKLLQDTILERLGVGAEDYEHYLGHEAYDHWKMRQRILHRIVWEHIGPAKELLVEYYEQYIERSVEYNDIVYRLELQFCLSIWAQIRILEGADKAELYSILEKAVSLTVPDPWGSPLQQRALSFKELNLMLEAEQYHKSGPLSKHYKEIIFYMEQSSADAVGMAGIYPKAVYFLCKLSLKKSVEAEEALLKYCDRSIEILRSSGKLYYLWELLYMREHYLKRMLEGHGKGGKGESSHPLACLIQENKEWREALESVYAKYSIPKTTHSYCYLYIEKGVACVNDVIRIRRNMLGMSRAELCQGICDQKTLVRLENKKTNSQKAVVVELFERLGLAGTLSRTVLVTERPEVRRLISRMRWYNINFEIDKAEIILAQIKALVSADKKCNLQFLMQQEVNLQGQRQELDDETYCQKMQEALELTLPFKAFLKKGEKYLTYQEQICIQNLMQKMDKKGDDFRNCMERFEEMYIPIVEGELIETVNEIYGFVMRYVQSELEGLGKYNQAKRYAENIIREELRSYRMPFIARCLYACWRNDTQRRGHGILTGRMLDTKTELTNCIRFSRLSKLTFDESYFKEMLQHGTK